MKKILFIGAIMLFCGCIRAQIKNQEFEKFTNLFIEIKKYPYNYKKDTPIPIYKDYQKHEISLLEATKYLNFSNEDWYAIEEDYNYDEDIRTERIVENPPLAHLKSYDNNFIELVYRSDRGLDNDTLKIILETFTLEGVSINKILVGGEFTKEDDWIDFVFLSNTTFKTFQYLPNLENYNIKGGVYYVIDEEQPQTVVEINDYEIDETGKINLIKTYPKQYLKEPVSFYRSYQKDSDDPMNEY